VPTPKINVPTLLETDRLLIRRVGPDDLDDLVALNADPQVMQLVGPPLSADQSLELLQRMLTEYTQGPTGWFAAEQHSDGAFVGLVALKRISDTNRLALGPRLCSGGEIEVGWRLRPAYWGRGYATESGRALLAYGFDELRLARIIALALKDNHASCRAIEKLGLRFVSDYEVIGRPARLYEVKRAEYRGHPN
jgi:RimJ/RimL family protein N-acetyltransferase